MAQERNIQARRPPGMHPPRHLASAPRPGTSPRHRPRLPPRPSAPPLHPPRTFCRRDRTRGARSSKRRRGQPSQPVPPHPPPRRPRPRPAPRTPAPASAPNPTPTPPPNPNQAQHNLETIKAKEAAKAAQRKSELAHDRRCARPLPPLLAPSSASRPDAAPPAARLPLYHHGQRRDCQHCQHCHRRRAQPQREQCVH